MRVRSIGNPGTILCNESRCPSNKQTVVNAIGPAKVYLFGSYSKEVHPSPLYEDILMTGIAV